MSDEFMWSSICVSIEFWPFLWNLSWRERKKGLRAEIGPFTVAVEW